MYLAGLVYCGLVKDPLYHIQSYFIVFDVAGYTNYIYGTIPMFSVASYIL